MKKTTAVKIFLTLITALSLLSVFVSSWIFVLATGVCVFGWVALWKKAKNHNECRFSFKEGFIALLLSGSMSSFGVGFLGISPRYCGWSLFYIFKFYTYIRA